MYFFTYPVSVRAFLPKYLDISDTVLKTKALLSNTSTKTIDLDLLDFFLAKHPLGRAAIRPSISDFQSGFMTK